MLVCPVCGNELRLKDNTYCCQQAHSFDVSSKGYVNLLIRHHENPGDSVESIKSRDAFLEKGYYGKLAEQLAQKVSQYLLAGSNFLDAGTGTGYYLKQVSQVIDLNYYATDISKKAVSMASSKCKQAICFVGNVFHLPFADDSLDGLMSVFTPYSSEEFSRVVKKDGYVFAVTPGKEHLYQIKEIVYSTPYYNQQQGYTLKDFRLIEQQNIKYTINLDNKADIMNLWQMMPYIHTTAKQDTEKLFATSSVETTVEFNLSVYRKESNEEDNSK